jgi:hypothetical protein
MRITTEKVEELRVALESVGFRLLGVEERLLTEIGYEVNLDGSVKSCPPEPRREESTSIRMEILPLPL